MDDEFETSLVEASMVRGQQSLRKGNPIDMTKLLSNVYVILMR